MQDEYHELLDLVNDRDEKIGTILRGEMMKANYHLPDAYIRFVNGFVVNPSGLVFIQTRSLKKFIAPGGFDYSVAEHVLSGETYTDAIIRGFQEELGLNISLGQLIDLGAMPPTDDKPVFDEVYALTDYRGPDPILNRDESTSARWMPIIDVKRQVEASKIAQKASLLPALELLERKLKTSP